MWRRLETICRETLGIGAWLAVGLVLVLAVAGAAVGLAFPKWMAEGLLETPGVVTPFPERRDRERLTEEEPRVRLQYVSLAEYRRMAAAYSSADALSEYLIAAKRADTDAGRRLLAQASGPGFWSGVAAPVLPFSRRDAREFGDLKDAASDSLVGVDLVTDARTRALATEMLGVMSGYFSNAIVRERIRAWILKHRGEAPARQKALRAEIVEAEMRIETMGRRVQDLKVILARYPDSNKLDARQVVTITEGSDRFLSPLAQLVAAETSITQLRETIARKDRQARQSDLLQRYFADADEAFGRTLLAGELLPILSSLTIKRIEKVDPEAEWVREVTLRLQAEIAAFSSALTSFGIRNEPRAGEVASRHPARLAAFAAGGMILLLGLIAFARASLRARPDVDELGS